MGISDESERIVLSVPTDFSLEEFAELCKIRKDSSAYEALEDSLPLIKEYGAELVFTEELENAEALLVYCFH